MVEYMISTQRNIREGMHSQILKGGRWLWRFYLSSLDGSKPFGNEGVGDSASNRKFDLFNIKDLLKR